MTRSNVRSVTCPDCEAAAGEKCRGSTGKPRTSSHTARWGAYREQAAVKLVEPKPPEPAPLTVLQIVGIVRKYDELERTIKDAERAIMHGGNEQTMTWKREALEQAKRELEEFTQDPAHTVNPWWL